MNKTIVPNPDDMRCRRKSLIRAGRKPATSCLYQFQLRIADGIAHDTATGAWIPAFAGMTGAGGQQSISRIGIACELHRRNRSPCRHG